MWNGTSRERWHNNCEKSINSAVRPLRLSVRTDKSASNWKSFAKLYSGEYFLEKKLQIQDFKVGLQ